MKQVCVSELRTHVVWGPGAGQSHFTEDTACPSGQGPVEPFWHTALSFQAQSTGAPCWSQKAYPPAHLSPSCPGEGSEVCRWVSLRSPPRAVE